MSLELAAILVTCVAGAVVWRVRLAAAFRRGTAEMAPARDISIIVPARNEAHNLPALLDSLAALDPAPREVIVVDDHSTDGTGDIARAAGATVVVPEPLPADWNGKPWACRAGAAVARGRYLLFTDADTVHHPASLARVSEQLARTDVDLLSVVPTHTAVRLWERIQGVFHLLLLVATGAGARRSTGERRFVIGQYILMTRTMYDRIGGHGAVAGRIAEDLALGRVVAETGGRVATMYAPGLLRVRMYPEGFGAFLRGWRRSFHEGIASAGVVATLEISLVMGWLLGAPLAAVIGAANGDVASLGVGLGLYAAAVVAVAGRQRRCGDFHVWSAPMYPVFVLVFCLVSAAALVDRVRGARVVWKDRQVVSLRERT